MNAKKAKRENPLLFYKRILFDILHILILQRITIDPSLKYKIKKKVVTIE